jgi:hypothetical protein
MVEIEHDCTTTPTEFILFSMTDTYHKNLSLMNEVRYKIIVFIAVT